jgi:DNA adenine methylase
MDRYYLKPILRQAGNKTWFREHAWKLYFRACNSRGKDLRFVDPFCGSLAVPFFILPDRAWVNDANEYIINFYKEIVSDHNLPEFQRDETQFYDTRKKFNKLITSGVSTGREIAELFYYLNRFAYNGLVRFNQKGEFNTPFGIATTSKCDFSEEADILRTWKITSEDYAKVISSCEDGDFIFADPPYDDQFNAYLKSGFPWQEQVNLANLLAASDLPVAATNNPTERILDLYTSLGFDVEYRGRVNNMRLPKTQNGAVQRTKEVIFTRNIQ